MRHYEEFTPDDGVHAHYAKVDIDLPCLLKDLHFIDWLYTDTVYSTGCNRFMCYAKHGKQINEYELEDFIKAGKVDLDKVVVLDCKLSDYDEDYVGYQLMVKLDLNDSMFKCSIPYEWHYDRAKHPINV